ncbi:cbb3-type cytochrome c oxidase subunit 3 [Thiohalobacter sp. IOR34]|uniref:cbb3-type cytochrome oxidase subunit 3 n=1 Tax=Thiohalobacter sp. IOR34 TaxID=3057176 RepID=UPI0025AF6516|nr:cbb3-type cytochrome c oxidase subunit 3 [Thiohalobacter sp. IOR34]WJW75731.1 cbb3-type cytochrome c oxidase subunit 3 [Thiohalobacter sp. IOR34]
MADFLAWIGRFENSKVVALLIFFATFSGILLYVFTGRQRKERLESYKYMPFEDDDPAPAATKKVEGDE